MIDEASSFVMSKDGGAATAEEADSGFGWVMMITSSSFEVSRDGGTAEDGTFTPSEAILWVAVVFSLAILLNVLYQFFPSVR